jgi:hypothetical protein
VFQILWPDETERKKQQAMRAHFEIVYFKYSVRVRKLGAAEIEALIAAESVGIMDPGRRSDSEDEFYVPQNRTVSDSEWVKWLNQEVAPRDTDILSYLQGREKEFPIVAQMARDHLAIPATSGASECIFSSGSDLITKKRNQLGGDNIRRLLCMRSWGVLAESRDIEL